MDICLSSDKHAYLFMRPAPHGCTSDTTQSLVLEKPSPALQPRQLYTSSPTSDLAAKQGLGGQLGLLILVGCIAAVGAASLFSREAGPQTLAEVGHVPLLPLSQLRHSALVMTFQTRHNLPTTCSAAAQKAHSMCCMADFIVHYPCLEL